MNDRWFKTENLKSDWDSRTILISKLIDENSKVIEFGAGRLVLKKYLHGSCSYTPSDIVDRGDNTIICDLNGNILPKFDEEFSTAVFSGVLEYVNNVPRLIKHISNIKTIIISYAVYPCNKPSVSNQWVNSYTDEEIIILFKQNGYKCVNTDKWQKQKIYKFSKEE
jgi:hypothetical protein